MEKNRTKRIYRAKRIYSPLKQRILLLLQAGVALSFAGTIGRQLRVLEEMTVEWKDVDRNYLKQIVREFYCDRLVSERENIDGTRTIVLTEKGKRRAVALDFNAMKIAQPARWDGLWRVVFFDIPEKYKTARIALRDKLLALGFFQYQKSVYIYPYPCQDEVDFVVEYFEVRRYVRLGVLADVTNEAELFLRFDLKKPNIP